jgi:hypothetical protein
MPEPFHSVGLWYEHMTQASDEEVCEWLERARAERALQVKQGQATAAQGTASAEEAP